MQKAQKNIQAEGTSAKAPNRKCRGRSEKLKEGQ